MRAFSGGSVSSLRLARGSPPTRKTLAAPSNKAVSLANRGFHLPPHRSSFPSIESIAKSELVTECRHAARSAQVFREEIEQGIKANPDSRTLNPGPHVGPLKVWRRETKMQDIHPSEHYTDKQDFAVMTRTKIVDYAQLVRIADHLCRNAEDLAATPDPPCVDNCRIAGMMLGWAYRLAPLRIGTKFDY